MQGGAVAYNRRFETLRGDLACGLLLTIHICDIHQILYHLSLLIDYYWSYLTTTKSNQNCKIRCLG